MKHKLVVALITLSILFSCALLQAAGTNDLSTELGSLVTKINTKLKAGQDTEKDLAPELKEFDALLAKHKDEKTDEVAQVLYMKAMLYVRALDNPGKGEALLNQLKTDFPSTEPAKRAEETLKAIQRQEEATNLRAALVPGAVFPDFNEKDLAGKPLSIANHKGKVVLIDFWATWCGPCVHELPNVIAAYAKYHAKGFEIIGISLDQDRQKLETFLKDKNMTWQQFFDGKGWENKLASKYGIQSIPATFLLDGNGKIIGKDLRGEALGPAIAEALAGK